MSFFPRRGDSGHLPSIDPLHHVNVPSYDIQIIKMKVTDLFLLIHVLVVVL